MFSMEPCIAVIRITESIDAGWVTSQLSNTEHQQCAQLPESKKNDFIAGRIALKRALTRYTSTDIREASIQNTQAGWPIVTGYEHLHCSISHSHGYGIGIVAPFRVGVDLEQPKSRSPALFSILADADERALIKTSPAADLDTITALWVMKEAILKGLGVGLSMSPRRVRMTRVEPSGAFTFSVQDVSPIPWYVWLTKVNNLLIAVAYEQFLQKQPVIHWHHAPRLPVARARQNIAAT